MGRQDTATREFINDADVFADVFNYYAYEGRKVIEAQNLEELDTSALLTVFGKDGDEETIQRYRDALKKATLMTDFSTIAKRGKSKQRILKQEMNIIKMNLCQVYIRMMEFYL